MRQWDPLQTVYRVHDRFGHEQRERARPSLTSVRERWTWAFIHIDELASLYDHTDATAIKQRGFFDLLADKDQTDHKALLAAQYRMGAYCVAAAQCLHAIPDILAHAVYYSLGLDLDPRTAIDNPRRIDFGNVAQRVAGMPIAEPFAAVTRGDDWEHLSALVNESKHRSVVRAGVTFDATGKAPAPYWMRFEGFFRHGDYSKGFPAREALPFLRSEWDRLGEAAGAVGLAIDDALTA